MTRFTVISSLEGKFIVSMEQVVLTIKLSIDTYNLEYLTYYTIMLKKLLFDYSCIKLTSKDILFSFPYIL